MYLYAIGIEREFVKFGVGGNPNSRLSELQTGCPITVFLLAQMKVQNRAKAFELENLLHSAMLQYRLRGEWFNWTQKTQSVVECLKTHDASRFRLQVQRWLTEQERESRSGYQKPGLTNTGRCLSIMQSQDMIDFIGKDGRAVRRRFQ